MALYNPVNFSEDISNIFKIDRAKADNLRENILKIEVDNTKTWTSFNTDLRSLLTGFMTDLKPDFKLPEVDSGKNVPKYTDAKTFDDICAYLDTIKSNNIEENLKRYILKSQTGEEKYNYFARIFDLWDSVNMKPKMKESFLCCYAEILLTQQLTQTMLNFIISTFAKLYKEGLDTSLNNQLSGGNFKYEKITERGSFLHLVYAITFVDADDDKVIASKRSKEVLLSVLSKDDYNPRSFLDMTYYYAIRKSSPFACLEQMLRYTAKLVILNLFGDIMSNAAESFSNDTTLSKIESFLDFDKNSIKQFQQFLNENHTGLKSDEKETIDIAESRMAEMNVNYFNGNVYVRDTDTLYYFKKSVEPMMKAEPEELCRWMAEERRFYESYYEIESKTRAGSLYGALMPEMPNTETDYAYLIVHEDLLDFKIGNYNGIGNKLWKNQLRNINNEEQCIKEIEKFLKENFDKITNELNSIEYKRNFSAVWRCMQFDTLELSKAVNDELKREKANVYDKDLKGRSTYLLTMFGEYCQKKNNRAVSFMIALSETGDDDEDEQMAENRWPFFSPLRYQDAMLYMCLNCDDPEEMFKRINDTPGYDYYQEKQS